VQMRMLVMVVSLIDVRFERCLWQRCLIGVEKAINLPSLQTVRAVFPHTAFQSRFPHQD
jgi:hypothetical protein